MEDTLLSTSDAARLMGVSPSCIAFYRQGGKLPFVIIMNRPAHRLSDVQALIAVRGAGFPVGRPRKAAK
jgi:hypothetical protein